MSAGGGALRFLRPQTHPSLVSWNARGGWRSDWQSVQPGVVFATDWMGRLFLLLAKVQRSDGETAIGLLVPSTGESIVLDYSFGVFLGEALTTDWRNLLEADRLDEWRAAGNSAPHFDQVVEPKRRLFLGGSDEICEVEISPLVVAVSLCGQMWAKVKDLPPGTPITGVSIK